MWVTKQAIHSLMTKYLRIKTLTDVLYCKQHFYKLRSLYIITRHSDDLTNQHRAIFEGVSSTSLYF